MPDIAYKSKAITLLLLLAAFAPPIQLQAQAQPESSTFRVGLKSISIPRPTAELIEPGSDYRVLAEPLAPVNNRLVAAFFTSDELKSMETQKTALTRYALVEVLRSAEFADVSPALFTQLADNLGGQFGAMLDATLKDQQTELDLKLKALAANPPTVTIEKPTVLGTFFSKTDARGFGAVMPVAVNGKASNVATCISVLRVRDRVLFLYVYNRYTDEESVKWVRSVGDQWTDAILKANSQ